LIKKRLAVTARAKVPRYGDLAHLRLVGHLLDLGVRDGGRVCVRVAVREGFDGQERRDHAK